MTAGGRGEAGALWAGPSLTRLRWESHSCKLSTCRCRLPLASTRGDQASRVSAPFSKERTVCPPTKTTSPCGWALDSEPAAKFLPTLGMAGPPTEALFLLTGRWPLVSGRSKGCAGEDDVGHCYRAQARGTEGGVILQSSTPWLVWLP